MKGATVIPLLLLEKPHVTLQAKDFAILLNGCVSQWKRGEIDALLSSVVQNWNDLENTGTLKNELQDEPFLQIFSR